MCIIILTIVGDNFVRYTGDVVGFNDQLLYALKVSPLFVIAFVHLVLCHLLGI